MTSSWLHRVACDMVPIVLLYCQKQKEAFGSILLLPSKSWLVAISFTDGFNRRLLFWYSRSALTAGGNSREYECGAIDNGPKIQNEKYKFNARCV